MQKSRKLSLTKEETIIKKIHSFFHNFVVIPAILLVVAIMFIYEHAYIFTPYIGNDNQTLSVYLSIFKIFLGVLAVALVIVFGYSNICAMQFKNTLKSLTIVSPLVLIILVEFVIVVISSAKNLYFSGFMKFLLGIFAIGIFEEFLFRFGVLQIFLSKWHNGTKDYQKAALGSGILFGLTHIVNIFSGNASLYVYGQAIMAIFIGYFLSILYIVTKNIWGCVIFHAAFDSVSMFSLCFGNDRVKSNVETVQYSLNNASDNNIKQILIVVGFYFIVALFSWAVYSTGKKMLTASDELNSKENKTKTEEFIAKLLKIEKYPEEIYEDDESDKQMDKITVETDAGKNPKEKI